MALLVVYDFKMVATVGLASGDYKNNGWLKSFQITQLNRWKKSLVENGERIIGRKEKVKK